MVMDVKCQKHSIPLKITKRQLDIMGKKYAVIIGRCPKCQVYYINRRFFSASDTFQLNGQIYQFYDRLHTAFPPEESIAIPKKTSQQIMNKASKEDVTSVISEKVLKKEKATKSNGNMSKHKQTKTEKKIKSKKKREKEKAVNAIRDRIMSGDYKEYFVGKIEFVENIPNCCTFDGHELIDVQRVTFKINGQKFKYHAFCCLFCNTAYLPLSWKTRIQEILEQKEKAPPVDGNAIKTFTIQYTLKQVPVLETYKKLCPFCNCNLDAFTRIKYYTFDSYVKESVRYAMVHVCNHCKAVFADKTQLNTNQVLNDCDRTYTIFPSAYKSAKEMMGDSIRLPEKENDTKKLLPYEGCISATNNLSKENKIVNVYINKCHCQDCEKKYNIRTIENRTAIVDTVNKMSVSINVMFCKGCGKYFISLEALKECKTIYGGLLLECKSLDSLSIRDSWFEFKPDSVLSRCGYTVKEGASKEYRQAILSYVLDTGKAPKYEIIERINRNISLHENQLNYANACERWREDLKFVSEYRLSFQKKVHGLEFKMYGKS